MGYTHYWNHTKPITPELIDAAKKILAKVQERGILLAFEYDHPTDPPVANSEGIRFNGIGDEGHETFHFRPGVAFAFCKTACKPYDVVVVAMLATIDHLGLAEVSSDGNVSDWQDGVRLAREATGLDIRVPRLGDDGDEDEAIEDEPIDDSIEGIIEHQGWNDTSVTDLLFRFIDENHGLSDLRDFLRRVADEENQETEK